MKTNEHSLGQRIKSLWDTLGMWAEALERTPTDDLGDRLLHLEARVSRIEGSDLGNGPQNLVESNDSSWNDGHHTSIK
ncbi:MAG: hypothetical protein E6K53_04615 [Gammaproteobacteria bacterium]|nr:MAG: hypothetical protein E6K53_04615 [Gammaproteobacteria bacterium]